MNAEDLIVIDCEDIGETEELGVVDELAVSYPAYVSEVAQ